MIITNKTGLPQPFQDAAENDSYNKGDADYSITELIAPAYQRRLMRDHHDNLERDVVNSMASLNGQAMHRILERAAEKYPEGECPYVVEKRFFAEIAGKKVSGQCDLYFPSTGAAFDYKMTSLWAVVFALKEGKPEWEQQLNGLMWLAWKNGVRFNSLSIVANMKDWSATEARRDRNKPQVPVVTIPIKMWSEQETRAFLETRVAEHEAARSASSINDVPVCTRDEMWASNDKWAVKKTGNKKAYRNKDTSEEALELAVKMGPEYEVEFRPGERKRCQNLGPICYCDAQPVCPEWKRFLASRR